MLSKGKIYTTHVNTRIQKKDKDKFWLLIIIWHHSQHVNRRNLFSLLPSASTSSPSVALSILEGKRCYEFTDYFYVTPCGGFPKRLHDFRISLWRYKGTLHTSPILISTTLNTGGGGGGMCTSNLQNPGEILV